MLLTSFADVEIHKGKRRASHFHYLLKVLHSKDIELCSISMLDKADEIKTHMGPASNSRPPRTDVDNVTV